MKKILTASLSLGLFLLVVISSCTQVSKLDPPTQDFYSLSFSDTTGDAPIDLVDKEKSIWEGEEFKLTVNVTLVQATTYPVAFKWTVDNPEILELTGTGQEVTVKGLKPGETKITVQPKGSPETHAIIVRVKEFVKLRGVKIVGPEWVDIDDKNVTFKAEPIPFNATNGENVRKAQWISSHPDIGTVANTGTFAPVTAGDLEIKVVIPGDNKEQLADDHQVKVVQAEIILPQEYVDRGWFAKGDDMSLSYNIDGVTSGYNLLWRSLKPEVATVDENTGTVTGVSSGIAKIYGEDTARKLKFYYEIKVVEMVIEPGSSGAAGLKPQDTLDLKALLDPAVKDSDENTVSVNPLTEWTIDNTDVVVFDTEDPTAIAKGEVVTITAVAPGEARITAKDPDSTLTNFYDVVVGYQPLTEVSIVSPSGDVLADPVKITKGSTKTFKMVPNVGAKYNNITWTSSNDLLTIVSTEGDMVTVEAHGGKTGDTSLAVDVDGIVASANISVVEGLIIEGFDVVHRGGSPVTLEILNLDELGIDVGDIRWSATSPDIEFITEKTGVGTVEVRAPNPGEKRTRESRRSASTIPPVTITVRGGGYEGAHEISLRNTPATGITIKAPEDSNGEPISRTIINGTIQLDEVVTPNDPSNYNQATDRSATWKSNDTSIATVDNGLVRGVSAGTVQITAIANGVEPGQTEEAVYAITVNDFVFNVPEAGAWVANSSQGGRSRTISSKIIPNQVGVAPSLGDFESDDPSTVAVEAAGSRGIKLTGNAAGESIVRATDAYTGLSREFPVTVVSLGAIQGPTGVAAKSTDNQYSLNAVPQFNGFTPSLSWKLESPDGGADTTGSSINGNGVLTAGSSGGDVVIVATDEGTGMVQRTTVTVSNTGVSSIAISGPDKVSVRSAVSLNAQVLPSDADYDGVAWRSGDTDIATVDPVTGRVTGVKAGTVTIYAKAGGVEQRHDMTVRDFEVSGASWVGVTSQGGTSVTLVGSVIPAGSGNADVTWAGTSNATVESGIVKGVAPGATKITATDATTGIKVEYPMTVVGLGASGSHSMYTSDEITLTASLTSTPDGVTPVYEWSSSNTTIARIGKNDGKVTSFDRTGDVIFTVKEVVTGLTTTHEVTVEAVNPTGVTISGPSVIPLSSARSLNLTAEVAPANVTNKTVKWESLNKNIATVDPDSGVVTGVAVGEATIKATANGSLEGDPISGVYTVNIVDLKIDGVKTDDGVMNYMTTNTPLDLYAYIAPSVSGLSSDITWKVTGGTGVVELSPASGDTVSISALKLGQVKVTATDATTEAVKSFDLTVVDYRLDGTPAKNWLAAGTTLELAPFVNDPSNSGFEFTGLNWQVVDADGNPSNLVIIENKSDSGATVKAGNAEGKVVITATHSSGLVAEYPITVVALKMEDDQPEWVSVGKQITLGAELLPSGVIASPEYVWALDNQSGDAGDARVSATQGTVFGLTSGDIKIKVTEKVSGLSIPYEMQVVEFKLTGDKPSVLSLGGTTTLGSEIVPATAGLTPEVTYEVVHADADNPAISFNENTGLVTAIAAGDTTIKVTDGVTNTTLEYTVKVQGFQVTGSTSWVGVSSQGGSNTTLSAEKVPSGATEASWKVISGENVASVSSSGVVTGLTAGDATIEATETSTGLKATYDIKVVDLKLPTSNATWVAKGKSLDLAVTMGPEDASAAIPTPNYNWEPVSGTQGSVTITSGGTVTGSTTGAAKVKVTENISGLSVEQDITVAELKLVAGLPSVLSMGETTTVEAEILPSSLSLEADLSFAYKSGAKTDVVELNTQTGAIEAKNPGTTTIVVTDSVTGHELEYTIKVQGFKVTGSTTWIGVSSQGGATTTLNAEKLPSGTTDATWKVISGENVASVNSNGVVTGLTAGDATIEATETSTGLTATYDIKVVALALDANNAPWVAVSKSETLSASIDAIVPSPSYNWEIVSGGEGSATVVANSGAVKGSAIGTIQVKVTESVSGLSATHNMTVVDYKLNEGLSSYLSKGKTMTVAGAIVPSSANLEAQVTYSVDTESVATVNSSTGVVTGVSAGTVTVTATDSTTGRSDTHEITVRDFKVSGASWVGKESQGGRSVTLTGAIEPAGSGTPSITWTGTNNASVNTSGVVTGELKGSTEITAIDATTGLSFTHPITVIELTTSGTGTMTTGDEATLTATLSPAIDDISAPNYEWKSLNTTVATVDKTTGVVTTNNVVAEELVIEVTETSTGLKTTHTIKVSPIYPTKVEVAGPSVIPRESAKSLVLNATVTPDNATVKTVTWKSSDESVATVDPATGIVKGVGIGEATISAVADGVADGTVLGTHTVNVVDLRISGISKVAGAMTYMTKNEPLNLRAYISPAVEGLTSDVTWELTGTSGVVELDTTTGENVQITASKLGQVELKATDKTTQAVKSFDLTVVDYELESDLIRHWLAAGESMELVPVVNDPSNTGFTFDGLKWSIVDANGNNSSLGTFESRGDSGATVKAGNTAGTFIVQALHPVSELVATYEITVAALRMTPDQPDWLSVGSENKVTLTAELLPADVSGDVTSLIPTPEYAWELVAGGEGSAKVGASTGVVEGTSSGAIKVKVTEGITGLSVIYDMTVADFALTGDLPTFLAVGSTTTIGGEISPASLGLVKSVTFSSDKPNFATIGESNGEVKAIAPGTVTITGKEATTNITKTHKIEVLGFGITEPERDWFVKDNTFDISAAIEGTLPGGLTPDIKWTVKPDPDKPAAEQGSATPATAGGTTLQLTGVTPGFIEVTATETNTGLSDSYKLAVMETRIINKPQGDWISTGSSHTLGVEVYPANVVSPEPTLSWSIKESTPVESGATVATIDAASGKVSGPAAGTVTVLVSESVYGFEATYEMSVLGAFLADSNVTWIANETDTTARMEILPAGVITANYSWEITQSTPEYDGKTVAAVGATNGKVEGKSPGYVTVTIAEAVTGLSKTQDITVVDFILAPVENIWVKRNSTKQLTPILQPTGFVDDTFPGLNITWSVTGPSASVDSSTGLVTAGNSLGQVTVTATDAADRTGMVRSHSLVVGELVVSGREWIRKDPYPEDITVTLLPAGYDTPAISWSTQDAEHASRVNLPAGEVAGSGNSVVSAITGNTYDVEEVITLIAKDSVSGFTTTHPIRVAPEPMIMTYTGRANAKVYLPLANTSVNVNHGTLGDLFGIPGTYGVVGDSVDTIYKGGVARTIDLMVSWDSGETWKSVTSANGDNITHLMTGTTVDVWISSHNDEVDMSSLSLQNGAYVSQDRLVNKPRDTITDVKQWGDSLFENSGGVFAHATNLTGFSATDAPRLKGSTYAMFYNNKNFTGRGVEHWDMSEVTETMQMFAADDGGSKFNADLGSWDMSNVVNMQSMFDSDLQGPTSTSFVGKGLENWRPHSLKYASGFAREQSSFNADLSKWFTDENGGSVKPKLVDMQGMFQTTNLRGRDFSSWDLTGNNANRAYAFDGSGVSAANQPKY